MAVRPTYFNPRTGELKGIVSMTIGTPEVSLDNYIVQEITSRFAEAYDSDLVVTTLLKNFDPGYVAGGGSGFDSDQIVAIINENVVAGGAGFDSDQIVAIINENVTSSIGITDSDYSVVAILRNDLESDASHTSLRFLEVYNLLDSESQKVQALKTRVYTVVKDNDSDHNKRLNTIRSEIDSDANALAAFKRFTLGQNISGPTFNLHEYYSPTGGYGSNPFLDSDLILQTVNKGYNPSAATYDSDLVVATIAKAGGSTLKDEFLDSDEVYNMGTEHGWFYDSDRVVSTLNKNFLYAINIVNNNLGKVDSEFVYTMLDSEEVLNMFAEHGLAYQSDLDSESAEIRLLRADVDALVAGTYNDAPVIARLNDLEASVDSESARINLLFSNADSDVINIAILRRDADSDSVVIQELREQAQIDAANITLIRNDLDSDNSALQSLSTRLNTVEATNTIQNNRLVTLEGYTHLDSDNVIALINENVQGLTDSDLKSIADLRNDVDSDSIKLQDLQTQINNLVDDTGFDSDQVVAIINENTTAYDDTNIIARLDSDSIRIQNLQSLVDVLTSRADSDELTIQSLQSQIDGIDVADLRARLDSDSIAIQSIRTAVDSDYALFNTKIALFNGLTDSDLTTVSNLRNDVDSDSAKIQELSGLIAAVVHDSDYVIERTPFRLNDNSFATTSSNQILDTFDKNEHKNVKYIISVSQGTDWQSSEAVINHNGTTSYVTEYAVMDSGAGDLYTVDTDISGNDVRLLITPVVTNITVSTIRTQID